MPLPDYADDAVGIVGGTDTSEFESSDSSDIDAVLNPLEEEMRNIEIAAEYLVKYGPDRSMVALFAQTGLSSGTLTSSVESFTDQTAFACALEDLKEEANDKAKSWAARAVGFVTGFVRKIGTKMNSLLVGITSRIKRAGTKIKETAKAHPYATVAATVAAVGLTAAAVVATRGAFRPGMAASSAAAEETASTISGIWGKIKSPFGYFKVSSSGAKVSVEYIDTAEKAAKAASAESGGWSFSSVKLTENAITRNIAKLWAGLKSLGSSIVKMISSAWSAAKPHLKAGANAVDSKASSAIKYGNDISQNHSNFIVRMGAGILVFTLIRSVVGMIVKIVNWTIDSVRQVVQKTVNAICGEDQTAQEEDENNPETLLV